MALIFVAGCSYWLYKTKNKHPYEVPRQDKISHGANIPDHTAAGQPGWSTVIAEM